MIVVLLLVVMVVLFAGPTWVAAPLGWGVCVYLLWRAWPGVRADLRGVRGLTALMPRRRRGVHL